MQAEQVSNRKGKRERENTNVELLEPDDEKVNRLKRRRQRETISTTESADNRLERLQRRRHREGQLEVGDFSRF